MSSRLKSQLRADPSLPLLRVFALGQLCSPKFVELIGHLGGFHAVWLDQEHAGLTIQQIEEASRAARSVGLDSFVRLPATDYATVMRALEAGANGVMASMVRSIREVEDLVRWAKFHPIGQRGVNGTGADGRYGLVTGSSYYTQANESTFLAVQIEHSDAVEVVEQIAANPNIDFLFVGPADLSQSLGIPGQWEHPRLWESIERVARACATHQRLWAILPLGVEFARRCVALGCRMLSLGVDVWACADGVRAFQTQYGEFFNS